MNIDYNPGWEWDANVIIEDGPHSFIIRFEDIEAGDWS